MGMGLEMPLRILLADDHEIVRRGLRAVLEAQSDWEVTDEAANGFEAVEKAERYKPDVVLMDISMPELNGLEAARRIRRNLPSVEVLFLTMHESEQMIREGMEAGGRGFLLKSDAGHELVPAVKSVSRHQPFFSPKIRAMGFSSADGRSLPKAVQERGKNRRANLPRAPGGPATGRGKIHQGRSHGSADHSQDGGHSPHQYFAQAGAPFARRSCALRHSQWDRPGLTFSPNSFISSSLDNRGNSRPTKTPTEE